MTILGIDPGLAETGWGFIQTNGQRHTYLAHGCVSTLATDPIENRILAVYTALQTLVLQYKPQVMAIETLYFSKNVSSAMPVAHTRGAVLLLMAQHQIAVKAFGPNTIKLSVTGNGASKKEQVQQMVKLLLALKEVPRPNHAADALAVAICLANGATGSAVV